MFYSVYIYQVNILFSDRYLHQCLPEKFNQFYNYDYICIYVVVLSALTQFSIVFNFNHNILVDFYMGMFRTYRMIAKLVCCSWLYSETLSFHFHRQSRLLPRYVISLLLVQYKSNVY